ncbi:tetratricopeptide repeat protein [Methanococcoides methylutens]|uniref:tetratricopeptide repeat protein n=1 Tax=Methanococcoides methylutens TaxID=2226 RepID=UPI0040451643
MAKDDVSKTVERYIASGRSEKDAGRKEHYFKMALQLQPKNVHALNNMALLFQQERKFREAVDLYEKILSIGVVARPYPVYYNISLCLKSLGNLEGAKTYINRALAIKPDDEIFLELKEEIVDLLSGGSKESVPRITSNTMEVGAAYDEWDPPAVSTLTSQIYYADWNDYKYHRGLGETDLHENVIRDKLQKRVYCCNSCRYFSSGTCGKKGKVGRKVLPDSICKQFFPAKD